MPVDREKSSHTSSATEQSSVIALMQKMNRNVLTLEDKAQLSVNDFEGMNTLSRLERDIVLADTDGVSEELQSLSSRNSAVVVMQIPERDLRTIGIDCSWSRNADGSLVLNKLTTFSN